nr:hotdog fold thioesterase [Desulfobacterales bacterium]
MGMRVFNAISQRIEKEPYAQKLGIKLLKVEAGYSLVEMLFTNDMENIFGTAHGGAIFSLVDEAFEVASNSHGTVAVALTINITYHRAAKPGSVLRAEAKEINRTVRIGTYDIQVRDEQNQLIATCEGVAYRKKEPLPFL